MVNTLVALYRNVLKKVTSEKPIKNLAALYNNPNLYSSPDMFSPPAERLPHVIRFELTTGCDWGRCTYCCSFDGVPFREKSPEEYEAHVDEIFRQLKGYKGLKRVFIGGGDALAVETGKLSEAIKYTCNSFVHHKWVEIGSWSPSSWLTGSSRESHKWAETGSWSPSRIALYGSTRSINEKEEGGMGDVASAAHVPVLVYWGVESGSSDVLKYVNKGGGQYDVLRAAEIVNFVGPLKASVMIMPGLGGMKFYDTHVEETAKMLGEIRPNYLTFMGVNPGNSPYALRMRQEEAEGSNRPLTDKELARQMADIIEAVPRWHYPAKIGCFPPEIDGVGYNPISFGSRDACEEGRAELIATLRRVEETL